MGLLSGCDTGRSPAPEAAPRGAAAAPAIRFRDAAAELGVTWVCGVADRTPLNIVEIMGGGVGALDYDGDGWTDIVLTGHRGCRVYRNAEGKRFEDRTESVGLALNSPLQGVAAADYDDDGWVDLLLTHPRGLHLYRNRGGRRFENVTASAGLASRLWHTSAAFADVNGDGRLDFYAGGYVRVDPGTRQFTRVGEASLTLGPTAYPAAPGRLYLGLGGGRFRDATTESGLGASHGKTLGVTFADTDGDGDQDLYLANDQVLCDFFRNEGRGRFREVALENGTATGPSGRPQSGMGVDCGDYDADGRLDLFVTTFYNETKSLYRQLDGGIFENRGQDAITPPGALNGTAFGTALADFNNDGELDLILANGHVVDQIERVDSQVRYRQPTQVLLGESGRFRNVTAGAGPDLARPLVGRGLAILDYDRDGRLDVVVANLAGPPQVLRNESPPANRAVIRLEGLGGNRAGLGAMVTHEGPERATTHVVSGGRSYLSTSPAEVHLGLGTAKEAVIRVRWPDGVEQPPQRVPANRTTVIRRPAR